MSHQTVNGLPVRLKTVVKAKGEYQRDGNSLVLTRRINVVLLAEHVVQLLKQLFTDWSSVIPARDQIFIANVINM